MATYTYPHVTIDEQLKRIERANADTQPKAITILGAGISGLAAAYVLHQMGHKVVKIYEASDRIGGRIFTYRFPEDPTHLYGELGAMRIPASHDYTRYFIDLLGLELRDFITAFANDQAYLDMRGQVARITDGQNKIYPLYRISPYERSQYPAGNIFGAALEKVIDSLTYDETKGLFEGQLITEKLRQLDDTSLGDFVQQLSLGPDSKELVGNFIGLQGWWDKALTMFIRDNIVDTSDGLQEIIGGMSLLPEGLAAQLKDLTGNPNLIEKNQEVTCINNMPDGVEITVRSTQAHSPAETTVKCDYVLCTIPFPVLRRMDVAGISMSKRHAISGMEYAAATKLVLNCQERFWETEDGIFGGASTSDGISRWTYYPSDHADANKAPLPSPLRAPRGIRGISNRLSSTSLQAGEVAGGPGVLLAAYVLGQDAMRLAALSPDDRAQAVIDSVSRFHPQLKKEGMVVGHASMAWSSYKWSAGAFAFLWPDQLLNLYQAAIAPEGRLFFAGEHCSTDQAWIQGALISSMRSVLDIVSYH